MWTPHINNVLLEEASIDEGCPLAGSLRSDSSKRRPGQIQAQIRASQRAKSTCSRTVCYYYVVSTKMLIQTILPCFESLDHAVHPRSLSAFYPTSGAVSMSTSHSVRPVGVDLVSQIAIADRWQYTHLSCSSVSTVYKGEEAAEGVIMTLNRIGFICRYGVLAFLLLLVSWKTNDTTSATSPSDGQLMLVLLLP